MGQIDLQDWIATHTNKTYNPACAANHLFPVINTNVLRKFRSFVWRDNITIYGVECEMSDWNILDTDIMRLLKSHKQSWLTRKMLLKESNVY